MNKREATVVALVPIKANSNRVKGKNFRNFCGKPLFQWIIETLLKVDRIDLIVINTDARLHLEQAGMTYNKRILVRDRKPEICGDLVSMNLVLADDIANVAADVYLMTHTTNPLISPSTIDNALSTFLSSRSKDSVDSLFTVNKIQDRFYDCNVKALNHDPDNLIPTQDLDPWYKENSNLYIFTSESFAKSKARIGEKPMIYEQSFLESIDIDDIEDWHLAVALARYSLEMDCM